MAPAFQCLALGITVWLCQIPTATSILDLPALRSLRHIKQNWTGLLTFHYVKSSRSKADVFSGAFSFGGGRRRADTRLSLCVWVLKVWVVVMILLLCHTGRLWDRISLGSFSQLNARSWSQRVAWNTSNGLFTSFELTWPAKIKLLVLLTAFPNAWLDKALNNLLRVISAKWGSGATCIMMERKKLSQGLKLPPPLIPWSDS